MTVAMLTPTPPTASRLSPAPAPPGADPDAVAGAIVAEAKTSFAAGMRILPKPRRQAMHAIYAFARIVDDIADGDLPEADKRALLGAWRAEVAAAYDGAARSAIGQAMARAADRYDLPSAEFLLLIEGMEMDAGAPIIAPAEAVLDAYIRRVAGTIGLLSMRCFGAWIGAPSERFALSLAQALQLTNILRDVEEDADIGRLYLPRELLERAGAPTHEPWAAARHPGVTEVCATLGARARAAFDAARAEIPAHRRARLAPALMMMGVYEGYLNRIEARGYQRSAAPVTLSAAQKVALGLRYALAPPRPRGGAPKTARRG